MRRQPIIKAAFIVTLFWWTVTTLWHVGFNIPALLKGEVVLNWHWTLSVLMAVGAGILCGLFAAAFSIWFDKRETQKKLQGRMQHGLATSIGPIPLHYRDLRDPDEEVQPIPEEAVATVPEIASEGTVNFLTRWHERYDEDYPEVAALMYGIETVLMKYCDLPATHIYGGHGGRTLLAHSLLVSWYMDQLAPHHTYDGKIKLPNYTVDLTLRRENYKFEPDDPLVALIGLVHDIGKIECYQYDADGKLIGCRPDHDSTGVRILARMPEYWKLSAEDRQVLSVAVKFYHHPQDTPTEDGDLPLDDRLHAVLELLIRADTLASRREVGENATAALVALQAGSDPVGLESKVNAKADLWNAIAEVLLRADAINGKDRTTNLGFKRFHPLFKTDMLVMKEDVFISAVCAESGFDNFIPKTSNSVSAMTKAVLRLLDEKNCLYAEQERGGRNPETALYKVEFFTEDQYWAEKFKVPAKDEDRGPAKFTFASCIVINIPQLVAVDDEFLALARLLDYKHIPVIRHARLGNAGKKNAPGKSAEDIIVENEINGTDIRAGVDLDDLVNQKAAQAAQPKAAKPTPAPTQAPTNSEPPNAETVTGTTATNVVPLQRPDRKPVSEPALTPAPSLAPAAEPTSTPTSVLAGQQLELAVTTAERTVVEQPLGQAVTPSANVMSREPLPLDVKMRIETYRWNLSAYLTRACEDGTVEIVGRENGCFVLEVQVVRDWLRTRYSEDDASEVIACIKAGDIAKCEIKAGFVFLPCT